MIEMSKRKRTFLIILVSAILLSFATLTYAYFTAAGITGNVTEANVVTLTSELGVIRVRYLNGNTINSTSVVLNEDEGDFNQLLKLSIENEGTVDQDVVIHFEDLINGFCKYASNNTCTNVNTDTDVRNEINYTLYECNNETNYVNAEVGDMTGCTDNLSEVNTTMPETGNRDKIHTNARITLPAETIKYYIFQLTIENKDVPQDYNQAKLLSGKIMVDYSTLPTLAELIEEKYSPVSDAIRSTYVDSDSGVNFGAISSATNGQGLYINDKVNIANDTTQGKVKYFRGAVDNYVEFGTIAATGDPILWRVIRIEENGNVRLITQNAIASSVYFNSNSNNAPHVGYTYNRIAQSLGTSSIIKTALDSWYTSNLNTYASDINQSTIFCNDASGSTSAYGAHLRNIGAKTPSYYCPSPISDYGGTYELNIATITADEVAYAGGLWDTPNSTYYLKNDTDFWTMSPYVSSYTSEFYVYSNGKLCYSHVNDAGPTTPSYRAVIELKADFLATGEGTAAEPWEMAE